MTQETVKRAYEGSDNYMTEQADGTYDLLKGIDDIPGDLGKFTIVNPLFTTTWLSGRLRVVIDAAKGVVSDQVIIDQQAGKTTAAGVALIQSRSRWGIFSEFMTDAFPDINMQNALGRNDYDLARRSQSGMEKLLRQAHGLIMDPANPYAGMLLEAGCGEDFLNGMLADAEALNAANRSQNAIIKNRPKLTGDRIVTLNTCYEEMARVNRWAQRVFAGNIAKQKQYVYDASKEQDDIDEYMGVIAAGATITIATVPYDAARVITFGNPGVSPLVLILTSTANTEEGTPLNLGGGATITRTMAQLNSNPLATILMVKNAGTEPGSYDVEVNEEV